MLVACSALSLWAALTLAPADLSQHLSTLRDLAVAWFLQTRSVWPLAVTVAVAVLTTKPARHRWPQPSRRLGLGLVGTVGMIGLAGLAMTVGLGTALLIVGGMALLGLLGAWVLVVPHRLAPPLPRTVLDGLSEADRVDKIDARLKVQNDLRTTALQAIAGLAVLAGAVLGFQQLTEDRQQAAADRELTRQGQASERFTRAISQLGSDRREVQLGGIYGLEQIAQQAPANRLAVTEVLVAYLHRRAARPTKPPDPYLAIDELRVRSPDVQALLTVLGRRQIEPSDPPLDLQSLDLRQADLRNANLAAADLSATDLSDAQLLRANLASVELNGTLLSHANLHGANLHRANLDNAEAPFANLHRADLSGANLMEADLQHARLSGANLTGANLTLANFAGARLVRTNLSGANLSMGKLSLANLTGANLSGTKVFGALFRKADLHSASFNTSNLDRTDLSGADLLDTDLSRASVGVLTADETTLWPVGFDCSGTWSINWPQPGPKTRDGDRCVPQD
jgi:uncharacterized protein YjbI with pentapeptide repeats